MKTLAIKFLLLGGLLFYQAKAFAAMPADTTRQGKDFYLAEQQFLTRYGTDDTSRTLIRYYFLKRKAAKTNAIVFGALGIFSSILFDRIVMNGRPSGGALSGLGTGLFLALLIFFSAFGILISFCFWLVFSRRSLLKQL